ncbi:ATP synthase F1 subunit gamma [Spirochaeta cellobiosiphila]|uniref:ATP synthase F1 subunit gamma n=1 Tax=Spirochaeta cellobiosiphila TaxID=504483 RepID=UPI00041D2C70|nr:ATP synthase F1 subunit gamma [Spirochaeta cellobiosiphila]
MAAFRDLGRKITSLRNMQKVTRAMNMISSIKLRKYMAIADAVKEFHGEVDKMCDKILAGTSHVNHILTEGYEEVKTIHLILYTADKGLCGNHNNSIIKNFDAFAKKLKEQKIDLHISCFGNKAIQHCHRHGYNVIHEAKMTEKDLTKDQLKTIAHDLYQQYMKGEVQQIIILGNIFESTLQQDTKKEQLLPLVSNSDWSGTTFSDFEPEESIILDSFAPSYLYDKLKAFMLNSYLSEHSSRLTAMENATNNSEDLINKYTNLENHARQAAITNELIEIVSGKEALKG